MENSIRIFCGGEEIKYKAFKYPGGEVSFKLKKNPLENVYLDKHAIHFNSRPIHYEANLTSSDSIILLCLLKEYLDDFRLGSERVIKPLQPSFLTLNYTPYGRQDRGERLEPFGLKVFSKIINSLKFDEVTVYDPHSYVTNALLDNLRSIDRSSICVDIHSFAYNCFARNKDAIIVSPDQGAFKINDEIARRYGKDHIFANKTRDKETGEVNGMTLISDIPLKGRNCLVLDDICDGGRTFIELHKLLKKEGIAKSELFTTVGIYSKGLEVLSMYDKVDCLHRLGSGAKE